MDDTLRQYGLAGLVITSLSTAVVFLFFKLLSVFKDKDDLQERRLADMKEVNSKYDQTQSNFSQTMNLLLNKLKGGE